MVVSLGLAAMHTRRGLCYHNSSSSSNGFGGIITDASCGGRKRRRTRGVTGREEGAERAKRLRRLASPTLPATAVAEEEEIAVGGRVEDFFDCLPDDLVLCILCRLSSSASSPSDLVNVILTCKRLKVLLLHPIVLSKASPKALVIRARNWSDSAGRFLKLCADAGNLEASYMLGMIRFYCLQNRGNGASLMAKAAIGSHAAALYSLAVIQFNGSGGSKNDKDLRAGVALCARAAFLGHVDALRELGHCLQDGYGVRQNVAEGRRFLVQANARELASVVLSSPSPPASSLSAAAAGGRLPPWMATWPQHAHHHRHAAGSGCPLMSDFGCSVPPPEVHPANRFLAEWFVGRPGFGADDLTRLGAGRDGLRLCSHVGCGRPETRRHEFRRCSVCGAVNYCSRACQALDWKLRHKLECSPTDRWRHPEVDGGDGGVVVGVHDGPPVEE